MKPYEPSPFIAYKMPLDLDVQITAGTKT